MSHFVAYILQFQEIIVYKVPPVGGGEEVNSQPKVYKWAKPLAYLPLCMLCTLYANILQVTSN